MNVCEFLRLIRQCKPSVRHYIFPPLYRNSTGSSAQGCVRIEFAAVPSDSYDVCIVRTGHLQTKQTHYGSSDDATCTEGVAGFALRCGRACLPPTDADGGTGLPVVAVVHLDAGDLVVPLELVARVALERHRVPRLPAVPTAAAVHGHARVAARRGH